MTELVCNVCGKPAFGVVASHYGAACLASCRDCLSKGIEPWSFLVGGLFGCVRDGRLDVVEEIKPSIQATLDHYGRTEQQLVDEIIAFENEYLEAMKEERSNA